MTRQLIRNATVLPFTPQANGNLDLTPRVADILLQDDRIVEVAPRIEVTADHVLDATNHLLVPGFVDAHTHSTLGILEKCGYEALPLELWMLYLPSDQPLDSRFHYLCAAIAGLEALKAGTTTIQDDLYALPCQSPEQFAAVAQAYLDVGLRASLSLHAINKPLHHTIPYLEGYLDADLKRELEQTEWLTDDDWVALYRSIHQEWHGKAGRITTMLAPSAAQRVTPELMHRIADLSETYDVPIHTHLLETRTQAITGPELYGESVVAYAKRHGILTHRTTIAHGIWLTDADIELIAEAGATVVHNVVSNHRLCSGIAPVRRLLDAGVNVAIGTDGTDSFNLFNVIKMAGMVHSVTDANYRRYPLAQDVLKWATAGGARSTLLQDQVGAIAPGMKADFVLYDLNSISFTPFNQIPIQLVYAEHGQSVRQVFVNGRLVVDRGQVLGVNEADLLAELRDKMETYRPYREAWHQWSAKMRPAMDQMYDQVMAQPFPVNGFSGSAAASPARVGA